MALRMARVRTRTSSNDDRRLTFPWSDRPTTPLLYDTPSGFLRVALLVTCGRWPIVSQAIQLSFEDDSGSETLARFDFQMHLAALECVRMLADDTVLHIVCEWAEDYVIARTTGLELVSVKHREPSQGAWTLAAILEDGGVKHLYRRWAENGRDCRCRLQTNAGLAVGKQGGSQLRSAHVGERNPDALTKIGSGLGTDDIDDVVRFLQALVVEDSLPKRDDLLPRLLVDTLPPIAAHLGWPATEIRSRFATIKAQVVIASGRDMQASGRDLSGAANPDLARARALVSKTVTRQTLRAAEGSAGHSTTRLARKLSAGGLGPTDIERCKRLRADWLSFSYRTDSGMTPDHRLSEIQRQVQDLAVTAEDSARRPGQQYAQEMRTRLIEVASASSVGAIYNLDIDRLLGAAYEETDRCRVWWSDRFDADGASDGQ
jgi:hypothetical protein